ncbi:hypothetical protein SAMN05216251_13343 [Actinacidiphila alni]|uniref:Uncharacterized protein n=1 Tax=Actinacidiphila alni TaxID=380248 RepID=A0A1I2MDC2_9ACTN|nr:hypothetical protein SAMN05216251_13343 [Actinacidiphila alni]
MLVDRSKQTEHDREGLPWSACAVILLCGVELAAEVVHYGHVKVAVRIFESGGNVLEFVQAEAR